ncbi:GCG_CRPN prefix-to-repeats domain-containing protein [Methylobacterium sp. WSM2598]|uniref:GCG_CRPN prefix-to-repeats domain-containing protein n=1 Tax=Methylobacterium sp. WSM2598 TaxID=398261 RepID=UPI003FA59C31
MESDTVQKVDWACGPDFHLNPWGHCSPNWLLNIDPEQGAGVPAEPIGLGPELVHEAAAVLQGGRPILREESGAGRLAGREAGEAAGPFEDGGGRTNQRGSCSRVRPCRRYPQGPELVH